jgi:amino acid adenylation domain-containing protein
MPAARAPDHGGGLHRLVERQADQAPDAVAVHWSHRSVTYRQLDDQASRLAGRLLAAGVRAEDRVGICLRREPALIAALLAVLKAGACYVPLDPGYPLPRLAAMARQAGVRMIVTAGDACGKQQLGVPEVIDLHACDLDSGPAVRPGRPVPPGSLAYVMFTSGSTGRPRAVAVEHGAVLARMLWARSAFSPAELARVLAATSVCFDLSVFEIFAPLCWGGSVVLVDDILQAAQDDAVSLVSAVPSALSELCAAGAVPAGAGTFCVAGEPLPGTLADRLRRLPGTRRVINLYGPTEATVYATSADLAAGAEPAIGAPLPGTVARVLGDGLVPVPANAAGELYLSGDGLARCYWEDPAGTAERFLPDPYASSPGARMYRTGDRVRTGADGQLYFLRRTDGQVKLRGHRIELGEVAAALAALPGVRDAAAVVTPGPSGDPELTGALVAADRPVSDEEVLRTLRGQLPGYLVPGRLCWFDRLPADPRGKLDRAALAVAASRPGCADPELAASVAWRAQLGSAPADGDDFFANGGDSLLATWLVARIAETTGLPVEVADVFDHPEFGALTGHLRSLRSRLPGGAAAAAAPPAEPAGIAPLSYPQRAMWYAQQLAGTDTSYLIRVVITVDSAAGPDVLEAALRDVAARHEALRTGFTADCGEPGSFAVPAVTLPVPRSVISAPGDLAAHLRALEAMEAAAPMDLSRPPLLRAHMVVCAGRPVAVLLTVHHIVFDARSIELFVADLGRCHQARTAGTAAPPAPGTRLAELGARQRDWLSGPAGGRKLRELADSLDGLPPQDRLPADLPRPAELSSAGASLTVRLDPAVRRAAHELAQRHRASLYMVGLAAFCRVLADWAGHADPSGWDMAVGTAFGGRTSSQARDVIGCLMNMVPVRVLAVRDEPLTALLTRVREAALFAAAHQDVPFEAVADQLRRRPAGCPPSVQVAFGVQDKARLGYRDGALALRAEEVEPTSARLDLTLWLEESGDELRAVWTYRTDLFKAATIAALHERLAAVLTAPGNPQLHGGHSMSQDQAAPARVIRRRGQQAAVSIDPAWRAPGCLPAQVRANRQGADLAEWISQHRQEVDEMSRTAGAVLFRGFAVTDATVFGMVMRALSAEVLQYGERSSPRSQVAQGVYTSTDHPPDQPILLHNEQSYTLDWPLRIVFCCETPPGSGGRTPLADSRRVLARLRPQTLARFEARGIRYVRNYLPGVSLSWQEAFQTRDRAEVERYCRAADIEFSWVGEGQLRTSQVRPAVLRHPLTKERTWFNHALFFNVASLPGDIGASLLAALGEQDLPYHTYYGDGQPIEEDTIAELRSAYAAETKAFDWQRGDVLVVENMLVAHGREPFSAPRRILTAMADPVSCARKGAQ